MQDITVQNPFVGESEACDEGFVVRAVDGEGLECCSL